VPTSATGTLSHDKQNRASSFSPYFAWKLFPIVDRSTTATDWLDGVETGWTEQLFAGRERTSKTKNATFAKVRVAGSNPVFRSKESHTGIGDRAAQNVRWYYPASSG